MKSNADVWRGIVTTIPDKRRLYVRINDASAKKQIEEHRRERKTAVVCGECHQRGITAKAAADAAKGLERELTCAACRQGFPRQEHISKSQETDHFRKGARVVCANCKGLGFTAREWQGYECTGTCRRRLPKSAFGGSAHFARSFQRGTLKCRSCK